MKADNQIPKAEINVEGVIPEKQQAATEEIQWFLQLLSTPTKKSQLEVPVRRVIIAKNFNATVNEVSPFHKINGIEYKAQRRAVQAIAKTIEHIENDRISFSLIFDGEVLGSWEERAKAFRFEKFLHELVHIVVDSARFKKLGAKNFYADEKTAEGIGLSLALVTRNEYIVDRMVNELCQKFLKDDDNQPVPLARLYSAEGFDFRATLCELIGKMPEFIVQNVLDFKERRIAMDMFWPRICEFLDELLTVFAHCAATYDRQESWPQTLSEISQTHAYKSFLNGHLEAIHREWQRGFNESDYDEAQSVEAIAKEIRGIFHRCGLTLTNVSGGIYVSVDFV